MKTVLLATDGSDSAGEALDFAIELCGETGARLEVLAVVLRPQVGRAGAIPILDIEVPSAAALIARAAAERAEAAGVEAGHRVVRGDPAAQITRVAQDLSADLIVVGSRGLGAVGGTLFGSVSRALVRKSAIPVTVVKAHVAEHAAL